LLVNEKRPQLRNHTMLEIKQGGRIRLNLPIVAGQTWNAGQAIVVNSAGALQKFSGQQGALVGLAFENCIAATPGNVANDTSTVISGKTGTILLSEAVVVSDQLSGTGAWVPGVSPVYAQVTANLSYTATSGVGIGQCITSPVNNGRMTWFYRPNLTVDR